MALVGRFKLTETVIFRQFNIIFLNKYSQFQSSFANFAEKHLLTHRARIGTSRYVLRILTDASIFFIASTPDAALLSLETTRSGRTLRSTSWRLARDRASAHRMCIRRNALRQLMGWRFDRPKRPNFW
jgi:hypothetical protein